MATVNTGAVLAKVQTFMDSKKGRQLMSEAVDKIILGNISVASKQGSGSNNVTAAAQEFINVLQKEIQNSVGLNYASGQIGQEAAAVFSNLEFGSPKKVEECIYNIPIYFIGNLHRDSVYKEGYPEGVENIIALLNAGYHADNYVIGNWHRKQIRTVKDRTGAHFIDNAVRVFMDGYATQYNVVDILINDQYTRMG